MRTHRRGGSRLRAGVAAGLLCIACAEDPGGPAPDTTAPTVTLTIPACCLFGTGTTAQLVADAQDNVGVVRVQFLARTDRTAAMTVFATDSIPPFEAMYPEGGFTGALNGQHQFSAYAFDAAGNRGVSAATTIVIAIDVTPPVVSIVPRLTQLTTPGRVTIEVVTNEAGKVVLYDNGVKIDSITATVIPYIMRPEYGPADNGTHVYTATVEDSDGNVGTSPPVSVPVDIRWNWVVGYPDLVLQAVAVDGAGSSYTVGTTTPVGGDAVLIKLDPAGTVQWERTFGDANPQYGRSVAVDRTTGDVYIAGQSAGFPQPLCFITKYNSAGTLQWSREIGDTTVNNDGGFVATDGAGGIYLAGTTWGSLDGGVHEPREDAFVARLDRDGEVTWIRQLGSTDGPFNADPVYALAVDGAHDALYLAGRTDGKMEPGYPHDGYVDAWVAKYDLAGSLQWTRQLGVSGPADYIQGVAVAPSGDVYVAGWNRGGFDGVPVGGPTEILVAKYAADGTRAWVRQLGSEALYAGSTWEYGTAVAADAAGVYVTGMTSANLAGNSYEGFDDLFIAKYEHDGTRAWVRTLGSPGYERGWGIATDATSSLYVTGETLIAKHPR